MYTRILLNSDASENIPYNHPSFPVYIGKRQLSNYPNYSAISHWHDDLEFIQIQRGQMNYMVNGQNVTLKEGDGIFINSRQLHHGYSMERQECVFLCVLLHPDLLCANDFFTSTFVLPFLYQQDFSYHLLSADCPDENRILNHIREIYEHYTALPETKKEMNSFFIQSHFFQLFEALYGISHITPEGTHPSTQLDTLKAMVGHIQHHYADKITLDDIASSGHCCKSKCSALFHRYLKKSPNQYLMEYRLNKSIELLLNTDESILEIAFQTGFQGSSYFCEAFRKNYAISPRQFRQQKATPAS